MRKKALVVLIFLVLTGFLYADGDRIGFLSEESFQFINLENEVKVGFNSNIDLLIELLGIPTIQMDDEYGWNLSKYSWNGIELHLLPDKKIIIVATITGRDFQTIGGITIGSTKTDVVGVYGNPGTDRGTRYQYYYSDIDETWGLIFYFDDNDIVKLMKMHRLD